jgi:hypothetical protein
MSDTHRTRWISFLVMLCGFAVASAGAQESRIDDETDEVPTAARRASEWRGSTSDAVSGPSFTAGVGIVWFSADDGVETDPGFNLNLRLTHDLAGDFYVVGSYTLASVETQFDSPLAGSSDTDDHLLHVPTLGIGVRFDATPEISLFLEPKIGAIFGDDTDAGPVGGASTGVDIQIQPGMSVRFTFTGLVTDATIETNAGDADLDAMWAVSVGIGFEL